MRVEGSEAGQIVSKCKVMHYLTGYCFATSHEEITAGHLADSLLTHSGHFHVGCTENCENSLPERGKWILSVNFPMFSASH